MAKKVTAESVVIEVQLGKMPEGYVPQYVSLALDDYEGRVLKMINVHDNENDERICEGGDHVGDKLARSLKRIIRKIGAEAGVK